MSRSKVGMSETRRGHRSGERPSRTSRARAGCDEDGQATMVRTFAGVSGLPITRRGADEVHDDEAEDGRFAAVVAPF